MAGWNDSEDKKKSVLRRETDEKGFDAKDSGFSKKEQSLYFRANRTCFSVATTNESGNRSI
jgi:hypothetical protein